MQIVLMAFDLRHGTLQVKKVFEFSPNGWKLHHMLA
jgi:hypothetical protein